MFQKTYIKLAGFYLLIIMAISIFFSVNLYQISVRELDRNAVRQMGLVERIRISVPGPISRDDVLHEYNRQVSEAKKQIVGRLYITNVIILVGGGLLSYYLARRTLQPIEEAHEAQSRFTADASHELRTPIAAMRTEIEVALMNPKLTLKQAKGQLESNLEELDKLTKLSEGLLRLSQLENNDLSFEILKLQDAIDNAVAVVKKQAKQKSVSIKVIGESDTTVRGDLYALTEVFTILLTNAIKYSAAKSEVLVHTSLSGKQVIVTVADSGEGIDAQDISKIFERFYQADTARSKQGNAGYGLGLAIAKQIIDLHSGAIKVDSQKDKGSTFTVSLTQNKT